MDKLILAVVGLAGAGKTEAANYLIKKTNWPKVYFGQAVINEVRKRGWPLNEENERKVREELRAKHGMEALAVANLPKLKELYAAGSAIVESMYSWEEYLILKKEFGGSFKVLAIFSCFNTRAARMKSRPLRPLSEKDLQSRDYSQIENLHQSGPIAMADWTVVNESAIEDLYKRLDEVIQKLTN